MLDDLLRSNRIDEWQTICALADHSLQEFIEQNYLTHNSIAPKCITFMQSEISNFNKFDYLLVAYFVVSNQEIALKQLLYKYCSSTNNIILSTDAIYPLSKYVLPYMLSKDPSEIIIVTDPITIKDKLIDFYLSHM